MHLDQAPEGGKFRATAAAAMDAVAGTWGDGDMLCVDTDSSGNLIVSADGTGCVGVIHTVEGRQVSSDGTTYKKVIGGKKYTVFTAAEFVEAEVGASPALAAGDRLFAQALGDVDVTATPGVGTVFVGEIIASGTGTRLVVNVAGRVVSAA